MKAKVLSIQPSDNKETNRLYNEITELRGEKSLSINTPATIPLRRESRTFLVAKANTMAKIEGTKESMDGSITKIPTLKEEDHCVQIFHGRVHTLFVFSHENLAFCKKGLFPTSQFLQYFAR